MLSGTPAVEPGRVDREADAVAAAPAMRSGADAPAGQAVPPRRGLLRGELVGRDAGLLGVALVDPRPEVGRRQVGERQAAGW